MAGRTETKETNGTNKPIPIDDRPFGFDHEMLYDAIIKINSVNYSSVLSLSTIKL